MLDFKKWTIEEDMKVSLSLDPPLHLNAFAKKEK